MLIRFSISWKNQLSNILNHWPSVTFNSLNSFIRLRVDLKYIGWFSVLLSSTIQTCMTFSLVVRLSHWWYLLNMFLQNNLFSLDIVHCIFNLLKIQKNQWNMTLESTLQNIYEQNICLTSISPLHIIIYKKRKSILLCLLEVKLKFRSFNYDN